MRRGMEVALQWRSPTTRNPAEPGLVMTPQLMQAIKLLQLSNLDLAAYVEGELERNPLLERRRRRGERAPPIERHRLRRTATADAAERRTPTSTGRRRVERALEPTSRSVPPPTPTPRPRAPTPSCRRLFGMGRHRAGGRDDGDYNLEAFVSAETTLADHLAEQLALAIADPGCAA